MKYDEVQARMAQVIVMVQYKEFGILLKKERVK